MNDKKRLGEWWGYIEQKRAEEPRKGAAQEQRGKLLQFRNRVQEQHVSSMVTFVAKRHEELTRAERQVVEAKRLMQAAADAGKSGDSVLLEAYAVIHVLERLVGLLSK